MKSMHKLKRFLNVSIDRGINTYQTVELIDFTDFSQKVTKECQ